MVSFVPIDPEAMRLPCVAVVLALVGELTLALPSGAQGLADVAREEEARKSTAKGDRRDRPKVYTNKDLKGTAVGSTIEPTKTSAAPADSASAAPLSQSAEPAPADAKASNTSEVRNEAYWRKRMQSHRDQLERDRLLVDALQSRVSALTTDFTGRDDPAQRARISIDRQKALAELDRMKSAVSAGVKATDDLEEEARRAGVPPGWLR